MNPAVMEPSHIPRMIRHAIKPPKLLQAACMIKAMRLSPSPRAAPPTQGGARGARCLETLYVSRRLVQTLSCVVDTAGAVGASRALGQAGEGRPRTWARATARRRCLPVARGRRLRPLQHSALQLQNVCIEHCAARAGGRPGEARATRDRRGGARQKVVQSGARLRVAPTKSGSGSSDGAPPCSCRLVPVPAISGSGVRHARIGPTRELLHSAAEGKADAGRGHGELEDVRQ